MIFLAEFANDGNSVIIDADSPEEALERLRKEEIEEQPERLVEMQKGILLAEVVTAENDEGDEMFVCEPGVDLDNWLAGREAMRGLANHPIEVDAATVLQPEAGNGRSG